MDAYSLLRTLGALGIVLGLLAGALWAVRRFDIKLPGRMSIGGNGSRRLEVIERTTLDGRRSVALLRRDGREHLILLAPEGNLVLETAIIRDEIDHAAEAARLEAQREALEASKAEAEAVRQSFFAMVDSARAGVKDSLQATGEAVGRTTPAVRQVRERVQSVLQQVKSGVPRHAAAAAAAPVPPEATAAPAAAKGRASSPQRKAAQPRKPRQTGAAKSRTAGGPRG